MPRISEVFVHEVGKERSFLLKPSPFHPTILGGKGILWVWYSRFTISIFPVPCIGTYV